MFTQVHTRDGFRDSPNKFFSTLSLHQKPRPAQPAEKILRFGALFEPLSAWKL